MTEPTLDDLKNYIGKPFYFFDNTNTLRMDTLDEWIISSRYSEKIISNLIIPRTKGRYHPEYSLPLEKIYFTLKAAYEAQIIQLNSTIDQLKLRISELEE